MERGKITVLIADDHGLFRTGLKTLLKTIPEIKVVGEAANGREMIDMAVMLQPAVIIADVEMPAMSAIEATRELCQRIPYCRMLILSVYAREETVLRIIEAGAIGYILKTAEPEVIREAIFTIHEYKPFFCKSVTGMLSEMVSRQHKFPVKPVVFFTEREKEIIYLICEEQTSKSIAATLNLSKRTVEGHRTRIMDKIGAKSVAGIIAYAFAKGLNKRPGSAAPPNE